MNEDIWYDEPQSLDEGHMYCVIGKRQYLMPIPTRRSRPSQPITREPLARSLNHIRQTYIRVAETDHTSRALGRIVTLSHIDGMRLF